MIYSRSSTAIATASACVAAGFSYFTNQSPSPALCTFFFGGGVAEMLTRYRHRIAVEEEPFIPLFETTYCVIAAATCDLIYCQFTSEECNLFYIDPWPKFVPTICASIIGMGVDYMITALFLDIFYPKHDHID